MKKLLLTTLALLGAFTINLQADESAEMKGAVIVPTGTYTGKVARADAKEKEIYVKTDDEKLIELYFTPDTKLTKSGVPVTFDVLEKGQTVEVQVTSDGKKVTPMVVSIVEGKSNPAKSNP